MNGVMRRLPAAALAVAVFVVTLAGFAAPAGASSGEVISPTFQGYKATVLGDVCNLRAAPNISSSILGIVTLGTVLDVVNFQGNWAKVNYAGKEAWVAGWLVDIDLLSAGVSARIVRTDVNLRVGPGTEFGVKTMAQKDSSYPAEVKRGEWIRVSLSGGDSAWVSESLLQLEKSGYTRPAGSYGLGDLLVYPAKDSLSVTQTAVKGSEVIARLSRGESARVADCQGAWIAVELSGGTRGWVFGPDARLSSPAYPSISFALSDSSWSIGKYQTIAVTHTDVNFRSGPGTSYPVVATLSNGDVLRVLQQDGEWTKAISPRGVTGWVATYLTGGSVADATPAFSLNAEAKNASRLLTVTGPFVNAVVLPGADGRSVIVSTSDFFKASATLPVNAFEFAEMRVSGSDVTLSFGIRSRYTVVSNAPGKVVLEFTPAVTSVDVQAEGSEDVLTIGMVGYAVPEVSRSADSVTFFLPGASWAGAEAPSVTSQGKLIRSVSVAARPGGTDVILRTQANTPYQLTMTGSSIEARFGSAGLTGKRIVVDPGHEADDPGAIGPTGLAERNVNWEIAVRLVNRLKAAGADAILTRSALYAPTEAPKGWTPGPNQYSGSLGKRAAWSEGADLFISIHNNSNNDEDVCGTTTYVCYSVLNAAESRRFAALVQKELVKSIGTADLGVKDSELYVVRESASAAVLVETMFISNRREEAYLRLPATWDKEAAGLLKAVQEYFAAGK